MASVMEYLESQEIDAELIEEVKEFREKYTVGPTCEDK